MNFLAVLKALPQGGTTFLKHSGDVLTGGVVHTRSLLRGTEPGDPEEVIRMTALITAAVQFLIDHSEEPLATKGFAETGCLPALIQCSNLRSQDEITFTTVLRAIGKFSTVPCCQKAVTDNYASFEQLFSRVSSFKTAHTLTLPIASATVALTHGLASYGGGCHVIVGQGGVPPLADCLRSILLYPMLIFSYFF